MEQKFCKDCTYFMPNDLECYIAKRVDLVTGETQYGSASGERHSMLKTSCGPNAQYWAPLTVHPTTESTNGYEG